MLIEVMKKTSKKFHRGALTIMMNFLLTFTGIALKLEKVSTLNQFHSRGVLKEISGGDVLLGPWNP